MDVVSGSNSVVEIEMDKTEIEILWKRSMGKSECLEKISVGVFPQYPVYVLHLQGNYSET